MAKEIDEEIINADYRQIYNDISIINILNNNCFVENIKILNLIFKENFNVKKFEDYSNDSVEKILNNNKKIILCGRIELYISANIFDIQKFQKLMKK